MIHGGGTGTPRWRPNDHYTCSCALCSSLFSWASQISSNIRFCSSAAKSSPDRCPSRGRRRSDHITGCGQQGYCKSSFTSLYWTALTLNLICNYKLSQSPRDTFYLSQSLMLIKKIFFFIVLVKPLNRTPWCSNWVYGSLVLQTLN